MDTSALLPADGAVTLRSLPRRVDGALAPLHGAHFDRQVERPGLTGRSAIEIVHQATRSLVLLSRALDQLLVEERPVLHGAVVDRDLRDFSFAPHGPMEEILAELGDVCDSSADTIDRVPPEAWNRTAEVSGQTEAVTALWVLRELVSTAIDHLDDLGTTVRQIA